jgi:hypothetical protein
MRCAQAVQHSEAALGSQTQRRVRHRRDDLGRTLLLRYGGVDAPLGEQGGRQPCLGERAELRLRCQQLRKPPSRPCCRPGVRTARRPEQRQ